MKTGVQVGQAMTSNPTSIDCKKTLTDCAKAMAEHHVGALLVTDANKPVGIITERDIVYKAVSANKDVTSEVVRSVMTEDYVQIEPAEDIFHAIVKMRDNNVRQLCVFDQNKFVGLLTTRDVLRVEPQLFDLLHEKMELSRRDFDQREISDQSSMSL